ncbi:MAG: hypothetical protein HY591_00705 [Candidatus Omnitrophica bacterium]|nr:hypothetical protein [Candidatus Omnitrophota bacterium]
MLSDEEKMEMLQDARSESRREAFARARGNALNRSRTWAEYFSFLRSVQNIFPQKKSVKSIEGNNFRL